MIQMVVSIQGKKVRKEFACEISELKGRMYLSTTTKHMWLSSKTRNQLACGALRHTRHLPIRSELQAFLSEGIDQVFRDFRKRKFYSIKFSLV